jgi:hypothetical protein
MSVLDTFWLIFEGNSAGAEAAAKRAETAGVSSAHHVTEAMKIEQAEVRELSEVFSVLGEHIGRIHTQNKKFFEEIIGAYLGAEAFKKLEEGVTETAEAMHKLGETAEQFDLNVTEIDQWGQAVTRNGGSTEEFTQTLSSLQTQLERVAIGAGSRVKKIFEDLHIAATDSTGKVKSSFAVLTELQQKFQTLSKSESAGLGRALRLDPATIRLLQQSNEEFTKTMDHVKALGLATEENVVVSKEFVEAQKDVDQAWRNINLTLGEFILPAVAWVMEKFAEFFAWLGKHKNLVVGFFEVMGAAAIAFGIAIAIAFWPVTLVIGAILAIGAAWALVYDDIKTYLNGGKSLIGDFINYMKEHFGGVLEFLKGLWEIFWGILTGNIDTFRQGFVDAIEGIKKAWEGLVAWFKGKPIGGTALPVTITQEQIRQAEAPESSPLPPALRGAGRGIYELPPDVSNQVAAGQAALTATGVAPALTSGAATSGAGNVTNNITNAPNITVNATSNDPHEIATQIAGALKDHYEESNAQYATGVSH